MTFRTRLLAAFGVVVLVPLAVFGLGIRREMSRRLSAESQWRVTTLVRVIDADLTREGDAISGRLAALKAALGADNRIRAALLLGSDRTYVLDYAGDAMRLAGLDFLQILDDENRVVSSGHFRNEYDRPAVVPRPGTALLRARAPEGEFLALVRADSLRLPGKRFALVGGIAVDASFLARLAPDSDLVVSIVLPGGPPPSDSLGTVVGELRYPFLDPEPGTPSGMARVVIQRSFGLLNALRRDVNFWFGAAVLVTALVAVLLAGWLSTRISRPVTLMEHRAAMGDLARQVNHDIKNALAPLRNVFRHLAQVAQREPATLPLVFAERQGTVESSIGYLENLAANYARLYPQTKGGSADANAVVREALRQVTAADHAELRTELRDGLPPVRVDALVLRRVIENLLGNAVDSLEGRPGTVTIATERGGDERGVRITVGDTGRGMTQAELARAFDDFYTTKPGGTGLGLSIVRRLVLDAAGSLRVETEPGKGSRFIVELPAT